MWGWASFGNLAAGVIEIHRMIQFELEPGGWWPLVRECFPSFRMVAAPQVWRRAGSPLSLFLVDVDQFGLFQIAETGMRMELFYLSGFILRANQSAQCLRLKLRDTRPAR